MAVILKLHLSHGTDTNEDYVDKLPRDELMRTIIALPSAKAANKGNSSSKTNAKIVEDFLNFLSFNLTYNEFFSRERIQMKGDTLKAVRDAVPILRHNHTILARYVRSFDSTAFDSLFPTGLEANVKTQSILERRRWVTGNLKEGVRTCFPPRGLDQRFLWVHHAFLLQFIIPLVHQRIKAEDGFTVVAGDGPDLNYFLAKLHIKYVPGYGADVDDPYFDIVAWRGDDGGYYQ